MTRDEFIKYITDRATAGIPVACYHCGDPMTDAEGAHLVNGRGMCSACFEQRFIACEACGRLEYRNNTRNAPDGRRLCSNCIHLLFDACDNCGNPFELGTLTASSLGNICPNCMSYFTPCDECGGLVRTDGLERYEGRGLCYSCAESIIPPYVRQPVQNYNYRPEPLFCKTDAEPEPLGYYGFELEMDDGDDVDDAARALWQASPAFYVKHDGSLSRQGLELVTHPCTLAYHMNETPFDRIADIARAYGYKSHDTDSCGLHVHASRSLLGSTRTAQDLSIAKILLIVFRFWDAEIVPFSRRERKNIDEWASRPDIYLNGLDANDDDAILRKCRNYIECTNRYQAVNLQNKHTVEFRIFRGTLRRDTLVASLQFVDFLIRRVQMMTLREVLSMTWGEIFAPSEYKELNEYMKTKLGGK